MFWSFSEIYFRFLYCCSVLFFFLFTDPNRDSKTVTPSELWALFSVGPLAIIQFVHLRLQNKIIQIESHKQHKQQERPLEPKQSDTKNRLNPRQAPSFVLSMSHLGGGEGIA